MSHRFFCPHLTEFGDVILADSESHHLTHVLRYQVDDVVELFNGEGLMATCRIKAIRKRDVELDVTSCQRTLPPDTDLVIATAVPKGDRFEWLIEKATELGVSRVIPILTKRSVVDPRSSKLDKLRQTAITACKQSGRNHLLAISNVISWNDFLKEYSVSHTILVAHPDGAQIDTVLPRNSPPASPIAIMIGPEGGFTDEEIQSALDAKAKTIQLGPNILRIETAAIALAARILI